MRVWEYESMRVWEYEVMKLILKPLICMLYHVKITRD